MEQVDCPQCGVPMELRSGRRGMFWGCARFPSCRGTRDFGSGKPSDGGKKHARKAAPTAQGNSTNRKIRPGDLLESRTNGLGPGRALRKGRKPQTIILEYFDVPGQPSEERHTEELPIQDLRRYDLTMESRVYWQRSSEFPSWGAGRVLSVAPDGEIEVRSAGARDDGFFPLSELYVRWSKPLVDPSRLAAEGIFESPHNQQTRYPIIESMLRQRAVTRGLPGLLRLSAELHPHQLAAARRVLEDHTPRYLLADEVGLGKTIEALLVLTQLIVEDPGMEACIIVPGHLVGQWQEELRTKLHPELTPMIELRVESHDDPDRWCSADLVIVDEAHRLVAGGASDPGFKQLLAICSTAPRLLLLSATPALHNEERFLAMLHLLDPDVYDLADVDGFRRRLESRQELGRALLGLTPEAPSFLLGSTLSRLESILAGQNELLDLLGQVRQADERERAQAIEVFRQQVADTFQVHRRMVRTRRTEGLHRTFPLSGRHGCETLTVPASAWASLSDQLELTRELLAVAVEDGTLGRREAALALSGVAGAFPDANAVNRSVAQIGLEPVLDPDAASELAYHLACALSYELSGKETSVVFAPTKEYASTIHDQLADLVGPGAIRLVTADTPPEVVRTHLSEHRTRRNVHWLVLDRSAEHGTNLQYADQLVHIGLPGLVTDLEQRIGRLDRWSASEHRWRALEAVPPTGIMSAWSTVVREGFGVHDRSLAALQRAVEEASLIAWERLLLGADEVQRLVADVAGMLDAEVEAVREQDAIDAVVLGSQDAAFAEAVIATDRELDASLGADLDALMCSAPGHLRFTKERDPVRGAGRYQARPPRPGSTERHALVPLWRMKRLVPALESPFASRRSVALQECVPLLRSGFPLLDQITAFLQHDDRGRAFGIWRYDSGHFGPPQVWLRVDSHLYAAAGPIADEFALDPGVVTRRLDAALAPQLLAMTWNPKLSEPSTDLEQRVLDRYAPASGAGPSAPRRDYNLNRTRLPALLDLLGGDLRGFVEAGVDAVATQALSTPRVVHAIEQAQARLESRHAATIGALRRRISAQPAEADAIREELDLEQRLLPRLLETVSEPTLSLDAVGVIVLSSHDPWAGSGEA